MNLDQDGGTIRLGSYPYVNARVRAMRAKLLTSNDYRKLMKMTVDEMLEFLQKRDYRDEINEFGSEYEGEELLEIALRHHLANTYRKLVRIAPDEVRSLLQAYFQKFDYENLKTVLRRASHDSTVDVEDLVLPGQHYSDDELHDLAGKESVDDILSSVRLPGERTTLAEQLGDVEGLAEIEHFLDRHYYDRMMDVADRLPSQGDLFRDFLRLEAEINNVGLILRMKDAGIDRQAIADNLLDVDHQSISPERLLDADGYEGAVQLLQEEKIGGYIENTDIAQVERALDRYKIEKGVFMLHQQPLSINPILGYMISKEAEVDNLRIFLQASKGGLDETFVERNVIFEVIEQ
jgi:V/A-type H+-transporting ATPase subunit C